MWRGFRVWAGVPQAVSAPVVTPGLGMLHRGICWWHMGRNSLPGPVILQKLQVHIRLRPHLCHANISSALQLFVLLSTEQEWPLLEDLISGFTQKVTAENTPALDFGASDGMAERSGISVKQTIKYENGILKWYYWFYIMESSFHVLLRKKEIQIRQPLIKIPPLYFLV